MEAVENLVEHIFRSFGGIPDIFFNSRSIKFSFGVSGTAGTIDRLYFYKPYRNSRISVVNNLLPF